MHVVEPLVKFIQLPMMGDIFVDLYFPVKVIWVIVVNVRSEKTKS
jgi:hypothetical protein